MYFQFANFSTNKRKKNEKKKTFVRLSFIFFSCSSTCYSLFVPDMTRQETNIDVVSEQFDHLQWIISDSFSSSIDINVDVRIRNEFARNRRG